MDDREQWLRALDELLSLADGLLPDTPGRHLAAARTRVTEDRFNLVVLGEFKRGKRPRGGARARRPGRDRNDCAIREFRGVAAMVRDEFGAQPASNLP